MRINRFVGKCVSAATAAAMLASGLVIMPGNNDAEILDSYAASDVVVDTTTTYQTIRGFGGIDHPEWTGSALSASQRQTAYGNGENELGLTVLRVFVNPDKNQWNKAVGTAKFVSDLGYTVFASPWEPPSNIASSGGVGNLKGKLHLEEKNYGAYAQHLNDFGSYMKNQGVDLYSISVQNEPDYAEEWTAWSTDQTTNFIANYGDKITSTRLMSPESFQYGRWGGSGKEYYKKILANSKAFANCDVFGTHFYGTSRSDMDFPELEACGKEIWMTEVYVPNSEANSCNRWPEALQVGENIHNAMVVGNMSAYTWWYIRRSYGLIDENGQTTKRGWNMAQFSKWVRPGDVRVDCTEQPQSNVLVSAYKNDNKQISIVAINKNSNQVSQNFKVGSGENIIDIESYRTSQSENGKFNAVSANGSGFSANLPGNSITTFVVSLEGAGVTPGTEPDADGYWFHSTFESSTDSWSGRGAASVESSSSQKYAGSNALYVTDRTASWNGTVMTLGKAFKAGEEYSFSVNATYTEGAAARDFKLTLEYTDASGETTWDEIATGTTSAGKWVQLANTNYKIPAGSNFKIIVETTDDTLENFYIDEAIGAPAGTKIEGAGQPVIEKPPVTNAPDDFIAGDVNCDGRVDAYDMVAMRKGVPTGTFNSEAAKNAADVDADGKVTVADLVILSNYILGKTKELKKAEIVVTTPPAAKMRTISEYTPVIEAKLAEACPESAQQEKGGVSYGKLEQKSYFSSFCNREKKYNVLLPANYDKSKKYPVMYVMHGYWENQDRMIIEGNRTIYTKQIVGNAIAEGAAKEMILVFPYIYSSQTQADCSGMDDANNTAYDNFDTVLTTELMPLIEKEYSVATGRENTAITGFSMGGRESLNIGMKHPDLFGYVGAICPAPGATGDWKFASEEAAPSLILITAGGNDQTVYTVPNGYHDNFTKNNTPHVWHYYPAGYHGENSIEAHIYNFVRAAFQA